MTDLWFGRQWDPMARKWRLVGPASSDVELARLTAPIELRARCGSCRRLLDSGWRFCPDCGTRNAIRSR